MKLELLLNCKENKAKRAKKYQDRPVGPTGRIGPVGRTGRTLCVYISRLKQNQSDPVGAFTLKTRPVGADRSENPTVASVKCRPVGRTGRKNLKNPHSRLGKLATGRPNRSSFAPNPPVGSVVNADRSGRPVGPCRCADLGARVELFCLVLYLRVCHSVPYV